MAKVAVATASGVISATSGELYAINVTKVATGAGSVIVYDNPSAASGRILFQGDGLAQGSFDLSDGNGGGLAATQGIYVSLAGTTNATIVAVYE